MAIEEEEATGIPEWVVTFGDMMSLLLTFFIMLVSLSEIKEEERFQAMAESLRVQLGYDKSPFGLSPGLHKPGSSPIADARGIRDEVVSGGEKPEASENSINKPGFIRPGSRTIIGTTVSFVEQSSELTADAQSRLLPQIDVLAGLSHKIEIRGHTSRRPVVGDPILRDNWDLAFARCRKVMEFVETHGIDTRRIRMSVAGANEPLHTDVDRFKLQKNPRVEIFVLDETVGDLTGSKNEP